MRVRHLFSVDVEEHFQVSAFERYVDRSAWPSQESRVVANTHRLLDLMARRGVRSTCFIVGWVAERHPDLVRRIAGAGHEVASHSYWHRRVTTLSPGEFREDVRSAKAILEDIAGVEVRGFRAPSYSIVPGLEWAFDVLIEEGYRYDSSMFPIARRGYGWPGGPLDPHWIKRPAGTLLEIPMTVWEVGPFKVPAAGGGYFRQFPLWVTDRAFVARAKAGKTGMFYIHPWEVDPEQPQLAVDWLTRIRHYRGLHRVEADLDRLLGRFPFTSVAEWLASDAVV